MSLIHCVAVDLACNLMYVHLTWRIVSMMIVKLHCIGLSKWSLFFKLTPPPPPKEENNNSREKRQDQVKEEKYVVQPTVSFWGGGGRHYNLHEVTHSRFNRVVQHDVWEDYLSLNGKISHFLSFLIVYSHFSLNAASILVDAFDWLLLLILTLLRAFYNILLVLLTL